MSIEVISIPVGPLQTNCHVLKNPESGDIVIVDPGEEGASILRFLQKLGGQVVAIWNTHSHFDHIGANALLQQKTGAPLSIHRLSAPGLGSNMLNGGALFGFEVPPSKADVLWEGGEELQALGKTWKVMHTPGHSPGCCVIVCEDEHVAMVGDLVFQGSIGRTDLPGGDHAEMERSLLKFFTTFKDPKLRLYSGHGPATTRAAEVASNPFVQPLLAQSGSQ